MLAPRLTDAEQFDIIKVTTDSILPLPVQVADSKKKDAVVGELCMCMVPLWRVCVLYAH